LKKIRIEAVQATWSGYQFKKYNFIEITRIQTTDTGFVLVSLQKPTVVVSLQKPTVVVSLQKPTVVVSLQKPTVTVRAFTLSKPEEEQGYRNLMKEKGQKIEELPLAYFEVDDFSSDIKVHFQSALRKDGTLIIQSSNAADGNISIMTKRDEELFYQMIEFYGPSIKHVWAVTHDGVDFDTFYNFVHENTTGKNLSQDDMPLIYEKAVGETWTAKQLAKAGFTKILPVWFGSEVKKGLKSLVTEFCAP